MESGRSRDECLERLAVAANNLCSRIQDTTKANCDDVGAAVEPMLRRLVCSGNSLMILRQHPQHDYGYDAAVILRCIYDLMLQGLYIMSSPTTRTERAQLYLDFAHIERLKHTELVSGNETDIAKFLKGSPKRQSADPAIRERFDAVKSKYLTKEGKIRRNWYKGNLSDLAKDVRLEPEYEMMQKMLSGVVHSTPLTLMGKAFSHDPSILMFWYWRFTFRVLGAYAEYKGIALDRDESDLVNYVRQNALNWTRPSE